MTSHSSLMVKNHAKTLEGHGGWCTDVVPFHKDADDSIKQVGNNQRSESQTISLKGLTGPEDFDLTAWKTSGARGSCRAVPR